METLLNPTRVSDYTSWHSQRISKQACVARPILPWRAHYQNQSSKDISKKCQGRLRFLSTFDIYRIKITCIQPELCERVQTVNYALSHSYKYFEAGTGVLRSQLIGDGQPLTAIMASLRESAKRRDITQQLSYAHLIYIMARRDYENER